LEKVSGKPRMEIPLCEGNLNVDELIDWISLVDKYFSLEEVEDKKKVNFVVTKLKGHASIWWDELQKYRIKK